MECPICKNGINDYRKDRRKAIQHHLWGGHHLDAPKAHFFAGKIDDGKLTEEDKAEINQLSLSLGTATPKS